MFAKKAKRFFAQFGVRIFIFQALFFALSTLFLFGSVFGLMSTTLKQKDRELVQAKESAFAFRYANGGAAGVKQMIAEQEPEDKIWLFARLEDSSGKATLLHIPKDSEEFDVKFLDGTASKQKERSKWIVIDTPGDEDALEILSERMPDGAILQIGHNTDDREQSLDVLQNIFLGLSLPILLIGALGAYFFSKRTLKPIRRLIATLHDLKEGNMSARLNDNGTQDEISELSRTFNQLLDRIQDLLTGMKRTVNDIAHDLRTPMTRFRGVAEKALQSEDNLVLYREALTECVEASDRILTLVDTVMDIAEAKSGSIQLKCKQVNLRAIVDEILDLYEVVAEEAEVELINQVPADLTVLADSRHLVRAIGNLVDNAVKYNNRGGHVWVSAVREATMVRIGVSDDGIGIAENEHPKIWTRLYRIDESRSRKGLGLGLTLVKAIAEAHGGRVAVESAIGKGAEFRLWLPNVDRSQPG
ncbi:MAG: HAMP domain-containing sensor histidine kinase [Oligoflexia bacterium]|nr:HAMP domain-containing sensor histidine kinase [Oligoflexia bacterium]